MEREHAARGGYEDSTMSMLGTSVEGINWRRPLAGDGVPGGCGFGAHGCGFCSFAAIREKFPHRRRSRPWRLSPNFCTALPHEQSRHRNTASDRRASVPLLGGTSQNVPQGRIFICKLTYDERKCNQEPPPSARSGPHVRGFSCSASIGITLCCDHHGLVMDVSPSSRFSCGDLACRAFTPRLCTSANKHHIDIGVRPCEIVGPTKNVRDSLLDDCLFKAALFAIPNPDQEI